MGNWFETGYDGIGREEQRIATLHGPNRLWMPVGNKRELVFLDDVPGAIYEHNAKINGSWKNWFTCLKGIEPGVDCPGCEILGENTRYYVGYFTAVDTSEWTDKRGNKHQYEIVMVPAKLKSFKKLRRKSEERKEDAVKAGLPANGLVGCLFRSVRDDEKDPVIGGEFEFIRAVDLEKLFSLVMYKGKKLTELWDKASANAEALVTLQKIFKVELDSAGKPARKLVPFNYQEILQPLSPAEMRSALSGASKDDDDDDKGSSKTDNVPF